MSSLVLTVAPEKKRTAHTTPTKGHTGSAMWETDLICRKVQLKFSNSATKMLYHVERLQGNVFSVFGRNKEQ